MVAIHPRPTTEAGGTRCESCDLVRALREHLAALRIEAMVLRMELASLHAEPDGHVRAGKPLPDLFDDEPRGGVAVNGPSPQPVLIRAGCILVAADVVAPAGDAALIGLPDEFQALDAALKPPEMEESSLAARYDAVLRQIIEQPAEGMAGLVAKAKFMAVLEGQFDRESGADLGWSLARDLLRITGEKA